MVYGCVAEKIVNLTSKSMRKCCCRDIIVSVFLTASLKLVVNVVVIL